jgi:hypothetical protein
LGDIDGGCGSHYLFDALAVVVVIVGGGARAEVFQAILRIVAIGRTRAGPLLQEIPSGIPSIRRGALRVNSAPTINAVVLAGIEAQVEPDSNKRFQIKGS